MAKTLAHETKSRDGRIEEGAKRREKASRVSQKELKADERKFDPVDVVLKSGAGRLPRLLPIKYARMAVSPFAFFRGAVPVMAADLARLPNSGIEVQLCGDAHVQNLGSFAAPDGRLVFDFNDFDETIRGPWEWDVKRMAASIVLAGFEAGHKGTACYSAAQIFLETYCEFIAEFSTQPVLVAARHQIHREQRIKPVSSALRQSQRATPEEAAKKYTERDARGNLRFRDGRPVFWRVRGEEAREVLASLEVYRESLRPESAHLFDLYRPLDVGFKIVGTGSVGMRDYVVLMEGNGPEDLLFLQVKQEMPSAWSPFLSVAYPQEGQRTAEGQRAIQPLSDLLLGWTSIGGHEFLVRQLNDHKGGIDLERLRGTGLESLAEVAGELMARGHARSGDACMIHGYIGNGAKLVKAMRQFAEAYAVQTQSDYKQFMAAVKSGKIKIAESAG
ncbi:MAG: DUF2252 domain-containing protein [Bryobacteraceae bacterium]|jgi:uncharacterized protein (DUF2252 family)